MHDPYLYLYMRSFGVDPHYLNTYRREVGLQQPMPQRRRLGRNPHALVPGDRPVQDLQAAYDWVTTAVQNLATRAFGPRQPIPDVETTALEVERAMLHRDNVYANTTDRTERGRATRKLLWAQAKHWRALCECRPDGDPKTYIRERMPSLLVVEARLARAANREKYSRLVWLGRSRMKEAAALEAHWVKAKHARREAELAYERARAKLGRVRYAAEQARARAKLDGTGAGSLHANMPEAEQEFRQARQARTAAQAEYRRLKAKLKGLRAGNT